MAKKQRDITNTERNTNDAITRVATDIPDHGGADDAISIVSIVCRICFDDNKEEPIITPCLCKGSVAFVHTSCLEKWLSESNTSACELCHHVYETEKVPRYSAKQSVWQWLRHQRQSPPLGPGAPAQVAQMRTRQIRCDLIACAILTPLAIIVTYICLFSADYYNQQRYASAPTARWTSLSLLVLIAIMLFGYYLWVYVVVGYHGRMWYYWWQREWIVRYIQPTAAAVAAAQHQGRSSSAGTTATTTTTAAQVVQQQQGNRATVPPVPIGGLPGTGVGIRVPLSDVDRVPGVTRGSNVPAIHEAHHPPANVFPAHQQLSPVHEEFLNGVDQQQSSCIINLGSEQQQEQQNSPINDDYIITMNDPINDVVDSVTYCGEYYQPDQLVDPITEFRVEQQELGPGETSSVISYQVGHYNHVEDCSKRDLDSMK